MGLQKSAQLGHLLTWEMYESDLPLGPGKRESLGCVCMCV